MEEEDELEVLGNLLECWTNRGDGDELGDVEEEGKDNHGKNVMNYVAVLTRLFLEILFHILTTVNLLFSPGTSEGSTQPKKYRILNKQFYKRPNPTCHLSKVTATMMKMLAE